MPDSMRVSARHGVDLRALAWVAAALCATLLAAAGVAYLAWHGASPTPRWLAPNAPARLPATKVTLESAPRFARADYAAEKDRLLHSHEWVDADAGIARIPIEVAMRALAARDAARRARTPATKAQQ